MKVAANTILRRGRGGLKAISAPPGTGPVLAREYQAIFTNNGKPMVIVEADATISLANAEFERLSGYTREEIEGNKKWTEFVGRGDRKRMKEYHLLRKSDPVLAPRCFEFRFLDRHGKVKNVVLTMGQIPGTNKSMASLLDVTDRRRAEATQRVGEERYKTLFENSRDAIYITTRDGAYIDANRAALELFGYTREEMKKVKARQLYADAADARRIQKEIEERGFAQDFEARLRKKDGTEMDCLLAATAQRGNDGSILEYQCIVRDITERKRAEEALRESDGKYRDIFDSVLEGYFEVDLAGNFTFFNEAVSKFYGYSRDELMGLNYQAFTSPEGAKRLYQVFSEVYKTGNPHEIDDYEIIKKDGSIGIAEFSISLLRDASGEPIGFRGVTRDVTEKRKTKEALRESEERYRTMLESIGDAYTETDLSGRLTFINKAVSKALGYSREEFLGMNYRDYTSPQEAKKIYEIYNRVYRTGEPAQSVEYEHIAKDGTPRILEATVELRRDKSGKPIGFRTFTRDITERRRTEEALRQSEEKYRTILENIAEGYFENDLRGTLTFFNDSLLEVYGYTRDELLHMNYRQYMDQENAERVYQAYKKVYATGEPDREIQFEIIRKDGTRKYLENSVSLIMDAGGQPVGFRGISRDITERKQTEEKLRKSEEKYRTILENIDDGYYEVDLAGNFTFFNDSMCRIFGYPKEELMGMNDRQYTDKENAKRLFQAFNKVYRTGEPGRGYEYEVIRKDGTKSYIEASISLQKDSSGKTIGFRGIIRDINERKRAEEALRQSEEKYRTILESIEEGYFEVNLAGSFTFINDSLCRIHGYTRDELMGMNNQQYMDEETSKRVYKIFNTVFRTGKSATINDWQITRKNGSKRVLESSVLLIKDSSGNPRGFRGIVRDVTERKQMEEALRQSEEKYRTILEKMQEGYFEMDLAGNFTFVNDAECRNLGYTSEELIGMNNRQYQDETTAKKVYQIYNGIYKTGDPVKALEVEVIRKDGTKVFNETSVSLIRDAQGKPIGFRGISRDVTERKQAEEALRQSEERYRTIIENIQDGYFEVDLAGNFTFVNDAECRNLGYTSEELIGMNNRQYTDQETSKKLYEVFNKVYKTGEPVNVLDIERIRKDGTKRVSEVSVSLIRDAQGKPIGFRGISRDVTERKRAEERLRRYAAELERSNEEVKNFAYIVSHDLRVPLVNLKGYTSELHSALGVIGSHFDAALPHLNDEARSEVAMALHEDVPEALEFITNSVSRMDSFINAVLVLSRLGRRELKPEPLDMEALVQTSLETLSHQIQERGIEVSVGSLPEVVADRTAMEQIVGNILGNAVKYIDPERPAQIEVTAKINNTETIFRIQDTGRGIAQEDMGKVFVPFRRAGKQDTQGEGMGLAYVQTLVRRHGGRIWCESEAGKGTTFIFTITTPSGKGAHDG